MAYADLISLKQTVERLLNSQYPHLLPTRDIEFLYDLIKSIQDLLLKNREYSVEESEIRKAICGLEDVLEFHVSNVLRFSKHVIQEDDDGDAPTSSLDGEQQLKQEIDSFATAVKKMEDCGGRGEYSSSNWLQPDMEDDAIPLMPGFDLASENEIVGMDDVLRGVQYDLFQLGSTNLEVISIFGMVGIGKTTLAKIVYDSLDAMNRFDFRAFVKIGPNVCVRRAMERLLVSIAPEYRSVMNLLSDEDIRQCVYGKLEHRRYLIVLDDIWEGELWEELWISLPDGNKGSRIVLTTRLEEVAVPSIKHMRFLDREESWDLLRRKVFGEQPCPDKLERIGKTIAENCEGLPLAIIAASNMLSEMEKTPANWKMVERRSRHSLVARPKDEEYISKILLPSFTYLPGNLKPCFLYMGVFSNMNDIPASKLIKLWAAEGFLELHPSINVQGIAQMRLRELLKSSLVLIRQGVQYSTRIVKTYGVHYVFRRFCRNQAEKLEFFHRMYSYAISSAVDMRSQRRFCIHKNVLLFIEDVYELVESARSARSLLCLGPNHPYPMRLRLERLRLLRVLDALTISFYEFPVQVLKLVLLRYLAFTCSSREIPSSISRLENLEQLIVLPYRTIISPDRTPSYLPLEIWYMKQLRHLQVVGSNMPVPPSDANALLPNLSTLSGVGAHTCTQQVFQKLPNLKKLGVQIVLAQDIEETLCVFNHLSILSQLESFKCIVSNPNTRSRVRIPPHSPQIFPSSLRKLSLTGCRLAWEDMKFIGALPELVVLKLRCLAFQGPKWTLNKGEFDRLVYLVLEDHDIVNWNIEDEDAYFPRLRKIFIKDCYKLKEIPSEEFQG